MVSQSSVIAGSVDYAAAVTAAVRAPSMHNSQPWRFRLRDGAVEVRRDPQRLPASDPAGWAARLAAGAAVFNLRLALAAQGWEPRVRLLPDPAEPDLLAQVRPGPRRPATPLEQRLWHAVDRRHSNRAPFQPDPVPADTRTQLVAAAQAEGAWLALLIGSGPVTLLAQLTEAANRVLMRDPAYRAELVAWTNDVASPAGSGGPGSPARQLLVNQPLRPTDPGPDFELHPLVAVLGSTGNLPGDQLLAGQALQRVLLSATDAGLAVSMLSPPIEVAAAREQLRLSLHQFGTPQMVLRIGYGQPGTPTPRRPLAEMCDSTELTRAPEPGAAPVPGND